MFQACNLRLGLPHRELTPGVVLRLLPGEWVTVRGPSGIGKSTLLRSLVGLSPGGAQVSLEGRSVTALGWPHLRQQVALVPQLPVLLGSSVQEVLRRPFEYRVGVDAKLVWRDAPARALLEALGVEHCWSQVARHLSLGEQQRVCLARALLLEPRVLLLDEPTSALDAASRDRVATLLSDWCERSAGCILMTCHDDGWTGWQSRSIDMEQLVRAP